MIIISKSKYIYFNFHAKVSFIEHFQVHLGSLSFRLRAFGAPGALNDTAIRAGISLELQ
jgi:hypothetical protein